MALWRRAGLFLGALLAALALIGSAAAQTATWLDGPPHGWNRAGAPLPPAAQPFATNIARCAAQERAASGAEESAVAPAGWRLTTYWPTTRAGDLAVVLATAGYDGMCRPIGYQGFVFVGDRYAGALAPEPMASRSDGAIATSSQGPGLAVTGERIEASFIRYAPSDPLCCPSRGQTRVVYRIERGPAGPVVVPESLLAESPASPAAPAQLPRSGALDPRALAALAAVLALCGAAWSGVAMDDRATQPARRGDAETRERGDVGAGCRRSGGRWR
jgi:LppP/LprE lipoprotein